MCLRASERACMCACVHECVCFAWVCLCALAWHITYWVCEWVRGVCVLCVCVWLWVGVYWISTCVCCWLCDWVYVCTWVCISVCMRFGIFTIRIIWAYHFICVYMYIGTSAYIHAHSHNATQTHTYTNAYTRTHTLIKKKNNLCPRVYVCMGGCTKTKGSAPTSG